MHSFNCLIVSLLAPLAVHAVAIPATPQAIQQGPVCYNAPGHKAGTPLDARTISLPAPGPAAEPLSLRAPAPASPPPQTTWCAPRSSVYITLTYLSPLPATDVVSPKEFLRSAQDALVDRTSYEHNGGSALPDGHWEFHQGALGLSVQSANGRQMTFAAAARATHGLYEYTTGFLAQGGWVPGRVNFAVFDGASQVGTGTLSRA